MKTQTKLKAVASVVASFSISLGLFVYLGTKDFTQAQSKSAGQVQARKEKIRMKHASGTFEVKLSPQAPAKDSTATPVARFTLDKQFHGGMEGGSLGEMLAVSTAVEGSAGYVAMEQFTGTLDGLKGSFALQHKGVMTRGVPNLSVTVVPDSGTGELEGLSGSMTIKIEDGKHFYEFDYTIETPQ